MYLRWSITQNREQNIIKKIILKPALVSQLVRNLEHLFLSFLNFGSFHRVFPEKDNDRRPSVKFFPLQNAFLRQNYFYAQKLFDIKTFLRRKSSFGVRMLSWPVYFIKILSKNAGIIDIFYFFPIVIFIQSRPINRYTINRYEILNRYDFLVIFYGFPKIRDFEKMILNRSGFLNNFL